MNAKISIRFVTSNPHKIAEAQEILKAKNVEVLASHLKIEELQTTDATRLVRDKALKAFDRIGRPLFVEHTGLYLDHLNGLPGGLTQIFWDALKADHFAQLYGKLRSNSRVVARTRIAYCNTKTIELFDGEIAGTIVDPPRGSQDFQWDCVFQPEGRMETFAEMGVRKNEISMRRRALDAFALHLEKAGVP